MILLPEGCRVKNLFIGQRICDLCHGSSLRCHPEDSLHDSRFVRSNYKCLLVIRVPCIAKGNCPTALKSFLHPCVKDGPDLATGVLGIPFIHDVQEWREIIASRSGTVDVVIDCDYEIIDFNGGLYAADIAILDNFDDEQRVYGAIKEYIKNSDLFDLDERPGHYDLSHGITPEDGAKAMGHMQLEIYVPIKLKQNPA